MKKIGIGAVTVLVVLIGIALVVPGFMDWNKYKSQIETTASDLSERNVAINGDISFSIIPSPSFSARDVSVSNVEGGEAEHFITLKSVDVNVAFFPLLRGDIQVKKFILVEPVVAIEVAADGSGNWEFGTSTQGSTDKSTTELSFEQFQINNGQISYQDLSSGRQERVRMINASVTMDSLSGPFEVDGSVKYKNLPLRAELKIGRIRDGRKIPINLVAGFLENNVEIKFAGGLLPDEISPQGDGKINLVAGDVADIFTVISLLDPENTNQNGPRYNQPLTLETNIAYGGDAINISALEFEMGESRGSGQLKATFDELNRFEGSLKVNSFDLDSFLAASQEGNDNGSSDNEQLDYSFLEEIEGTFNFSLGALQYNEKIASQLEVELTATRGGLEFNNVHVNMPGGSELSLDGVFNAPDNKPQFNGDINLASGNLRAFTEWLKIDVSSVPTGRLTRLAYSSALRVDEELIQAYGIDGNLDTFQFKGGVSYALQDRTSFGLDMTLNNLNIDNYLSDNSKEPLDLKEAVSVFGEFDANYNINLTNFRVQGVTIKKAELNGTLFGGQLNAKTINIEDYAGFDFNGSLLGSDLSGVPKFETSFNTTATSLVPLQRAFRFKTDFDIGEVGAVAVNARISGNFEKANIDIKSTIGNSKADIKGDISSPTLKRLPEIGSVDLAVNLSNPSLVRLIDQFDLPLIKPSAPDDRSVAIVTSLKGTKELVDVDGIVSVAGGSVALKGRANLTENEISSFDMALNIEGTDAREFIRGLGSDFRPANSELGGISLKMTASGNMNDISLKNIAGNFGPTKLTGNGELNALNADVLLGQKSKFDFTLVMDNVPVKDFMEAERQVKAEDDWGNWSKQPMELALLNEYEGTANITANNIEYDDYNFENPRFIAVLKDGIITINNFTGKLFGGDVNVAGTFSSAGDLEMDLSLKNATIVDATTVFAGIRPVSGRFDMVQKISGKGTSQSDLISSLNGTGEVVATPGAISGIDIPKLSDQLSGLDNKNGLVGLLANTLSGGETPYQGGKSTITMKDGFIQLSPFDIQMLGADSAFNMGIDLAEWKMNLSGDMALNDHPDSPPIGLSVLGDLHDPEINFNTKGLETFIGAKIAASLLQNMIEGNGGLGTLFGVPATEGQTPVPTEGATPATPPADIPAEEVLIEEEPEKKQESVEELGIKLLERLFQKPPSKN